MTDRDTIQKCYIRVCRDSGFGLDAIHAAQIAAGSMNIHPVEIWTAFSDLDTMKKIAAGEHPVCAALSRARREV